MKRRRVAGLIDVCQVTDPVEINALGADPRIDRRFETPTYLANWLLIARSVTALSFRGHRFPTMVPRTSAQRATEQDDLWKALSDKAAAMTGGPDELEPLANWVRGVELETDVGILVQQLLGNLFSPEFVATRESWRAAETLVAAPRLGNPAVLVWWAVSGKVLRAKRLLASMVNNDLSGVNAIGIAVHNVVKSIRHLKLLYADRDRRSSMSPERAAEESLFAPASIYRQAITAGELGNCPFSRHSLFVLSIGEASRQPNGRSLVFMEATWSRCPANRWVPAMLQGVWKRACGSSDGLPRTES